VVLPPTHVLVTTEALPTPVPAPARRRTVIVALLAAVAGAAVTAAILLTTGSGKPSTPTAKELRGADFALAYPSDWTAVPADQLARIDGRPAAIVRKGDGHGTIVVRRKAAPKNQTLRALTADLTAGLERRFTDFRFVSARVIQVRGGNAFLYTFARTQQKTAQSIALIKVGKTNFTLDVVARGGDAATAREAAAIVRSFGP
jgi:hypothetical protein